MVMKDIERVDWNVYDVAIVMTNYNKAQYIGQAIDSVLRQDTHYKYLLIIVDDKSVDGSIDIIAMYEQKYPDKILSVFLKENVGCYKAQLSVYQYMKTKFFTVLDADDYWISEKVLDEALNFLYKNSEFVGCGYNTEIEKDGTIQETLFWNTTEKESVTSGIEELFQKLVYIPHTSAMFYRNVIFRNGIPILLQEAAETLAEASFRGDTDKFIMHLKYGKMMFINERVSVYRYNGKGIWSGSSKMTQILMAARAHGDHSDFYEQKYEDQFIDFMRGEKYSLLKTVLKERYWCKEGDQWKDKENYDYMMNRIKKWSQQDVSSEEILHMWNFIKTYRGEDLVIWGCGATAEFMLNAYEIDLNKVRFFIDKDVKKQKEGFKNKPVKEPEKIEEAVFLVIATMYDTEVLKEIKDKNLCAEDKIFNLYKYNAL